MISRRAFLVRAATGAATVAFGARVAHAQQGLAQKSESPVTLDSANLFPMDQMAMRPVRLPPKPGAAPSMTAADRDALEHKIHCQCSCTLDVYTCRTTDFSCQVSPAMHRDVMALVAGGYSAPEILAAFVNVYGERALMSPTKEGFNLLGYFVPSVALGTGAIVLFAFIRHWANRPRVAAAVPARPARAATSDELARIQAAIRDDR